MARTRHVAIIDFKSVGITTANAVSCKVVISGYWTYSIVHA